MDFSHRASVHRTQKERKSFRRALFCDPEKRLDGLLAEILPEQLHRSFLRISDVTVVKALAEIDRADADKLPTLFDVPCANWR